MGLDSPGGGGDRGIMDGVEACAMLLQQANVFHGQVGHWNPPNVVDGCMGRPRGQECLPPMSEKQALDSRLKDQSEYILGGGQGCDMPCGVWVWLVLLDEHIKSVDIVSA
jgi:hypothetical protein